MNRWFCVFLACKETNFVLEKPRCIVYSTGGGSEGITKMHERNYEVKKETFCLLMVPNCGSGGIPPKIPIRGEKLQNNETEKNTPLFGCQPSALMHY